MLYSEMSFNSSKYLFSPALQFKYSLLADLAHNSFKFRAIYYSDTFKAVGRPSPVLDCVFSLHMAHMIKLELLHCVIS